MKIIDNHKSLILFDFVDENQNVDVDDVVELIDILISQCVDDDEKFVFVHEYVDNDNFENFVHLFETKFERVKFETNHDNDVQFIRVNSLYDENDDDFVECRNIDDLIDAIVEIVDMILQTYASKIMILIEINI